MIPQPNSIKNRADKIHLDKGFVLELGPYTSMEEMVKNHLNNIIKESPDDETNEFKIVHDNSVGEEAYVLDISSKQILLTVSSQAGVFYGLKTLAQYITTTQAVNCVRIEDQPKYSYRGVMLDVSRHFIPVHEIKLLLDIMGHMKMNRFHWHLTDDHGWQIQLKCLEKIGQDVEGDFDTISTEGYYTREEVTEIIEYASERMIQIIPEIDMPGHVLGLLKYYPDLACFPRAFEQKEGAGITEDVLCVGKPETYQVMKAVLSEIADLFPYDMIHIGGDEVPKAKWIQCEHCREYAKKHKIPTPKDLQSHFMQVMIDHINSLGKGVILWNDALMDTNYSGDVIGEFWMTSEGNEAIMAMEEKYPIIDANFKHYYLDYPIEMISLRKTYEYDSIFKSNQLQGLECPLWTEWVSDTMTMHQRLYPRLFAVAEAAWTNDQHRSYDDFLDRLKILLTVFKDKKISLVDEKLYEVGLFRKLFVTIRHMSKMISLKTIRTVLRLKKDNQINLLDDR